MRFCLICGVTISLVVFLLTSVRSAAQPGDRETLGYRSCGTERGTCHQSDGAWWQGDPHFETVNGLKRKKQLSMKIAETYGMKSGDYLRGNSKCAECHGEVVSGRRAKNMNTGVSCESCHGPAGPKASGYYEIHQEGEPPRDPLSTARIGYQKALRAGMVELRDVTIRAASCVRCHQITDKRLLEAGHPTGEGFDYVRGIKANISRHWDYKIRQVDLSPSPFMQAVKARPIPRFVIKSRDRAPKLARRVLAVPETTYIYLDPTLPDWLNPKHTITIKSFETKLKPDAPLDSILLEIKNYIDYVHREISRND